MEVKCECGYEYSMDIEDGDWQTCVNCDLPYKHIRKSKWISVEDRMPDRHEDIIFYAKGAAWRYRFGWIDSYDEFYCTTRGERVENVTHWQPLPDPPEVDDS